VKTLLVVFGFEILAPELENLSVVKPEKTHDDEVETPGDDNLRPDRWGPCIKRRDANDPVGGLITLETLPFRHIDREENTDTSNT
jgi:hypothetical protein